MRGNYHNSRTNNDIDMKLDQYLNMAIETWQRKKILDDVMSINCDAIVISPICGQFGAIRKTNSGCMVCKTYIFIISKLLSYKNWKQNLKNSNTALILLLQVKALFLTKNADFFQKNADTSKIKGVLVLKGIFSETICVCTYVPNFKFLA